MSDVLPDVLIVIGPADASVRKADIAALGFGKQAAEKLGGALDILLLGPAAAEAAPSIARFGARRIFTADHQDLKAYTGEAYAAALAEFVKDKPYRLVGGSASTTTRDYFPRVAAKLDVPMASDVLSIDELPADKALFTRAVFVGNLLASVELTAPSAIVSCRATEFDPPPEADTESPVEAVTLNGSFALAGKSFIALHEQKSDRPDLTEADVVVSGGRGTKGADGFKHIEELADLLNAAVGATRAAVDAGWMPNDLQVGQTGKVVAPKLYFAIAVSGAIQHLAGMRNSKAIVAINKDAEAPIFEIADIGLVADMFEAVPQLTAAIKAGR